MRLAVLTNKPTQASRLILDGLGIASSFAAIVGGDSGLPKKPDPAALLAAVERLGVDRRGALMVGDSAADVGAARAAGLPIVVVGYGYTVRSTHELGADRVIPDFKDLDLAVRDLAAAIAPSIRKNRRSAG